MIKKSIYILLIALLITTSASGYKRRGVGHRNITKKGAEKKEKLHGTEHCWENHLFSGSLDYFIDQSAEEDVKSPGSGWWQLWRPLFHFYDPATHGGLLPWGNALTRMKGMQEDAEKSLKKTACALKSGDSGASASKILLSGGF